MEDFSIAVRYTRDALRMCNYNDIQQIYNVASLMYDSMIQQYEYAYDKNDIKQQYRICQLIDQEVLPKLKEAIVHTKDNKSGNKIASQLSELLKLFFALSARRVLRNFALYIEQYKRKKVWSKTLSTMECVFSFSDEFSISERMNLMRVSCMPGLGKSYFGNMFVAQSVGNDPNLQILRITYSDDLAKITTRQTKSIIDSQAFREIFPRYQNVKKIFKSDDKYSFCLCDCEDEYNLFSFTRDGQATGKRGKLVVIDDLLKGQIECNNVQLHNALTERYYSDWSTRADDDTQKTLLLGTMWADTDLLNVMYDKASSKGLVQDARYKWAEVAKDRSGCFIKIPALDRDNNPTCPSRYSKKYLLEIKAGMTRFLWMAVYQQNPIAPEGLEFNYNVLQTYKAEEKPTREQAESRYASLDPARKGKNFVSMPICYRVGEKHYLVDFLYKKKAMKEMYDLIVDKIIEHRINMLVLENNTDTSLKEVLDERLRMRGYMSCTIIEKYSSQNKEQRIKDHQSDVRNYIIFPCKGMFSTNTDMGMAIEEITAYSFNYPNKFDDGIDSLVLYAMKFIESEYEFPEVETFIRKYL